MANPFLRRATEYIRDDASFLSIVSPAPLTEFLAKHPRKEELFELPVRVVGALGSGKTMLATLAEFHLVEMILRDQTSSTNRDLAAALEQAGFLRGGLPRVAAVRVPMETEYRTLWELPYDPVVKTKLFLWLMQARAMLGLLRNLTAGGRRPLEDIRLVAREASEAQIATIGGLDCRSLQARALEVQRTLHGLAAGLVAPPIEQLPPVATEPYMPFEAIRSIEVYWEGEPISLTPLVMLDDVHELHPEQRELIFGALARREIRFGRWMMMRLSGLSSDAVLGTSGTQENHNLQSGRDFIDVFMQPRINRASERKKFRRMAEDMADRYLLHVQALRNRNANRLRPLLPEVPPRLTNGQLRELGKAVDRDQKRLGVSASRRSTIEAMVFDYFKGSESTVEPDLSLAVTRILINRYAKRVDSTLALFEDLDPEPRTPLKVKAGLVEGARVHLNDQFGRPLHYGIDAVCDASNENAELFLQLAGALVARMETRAIRGQAPSLSPAAQNATLRDRASEIIETWAFPYARHVRTMIGQMAAECKSESLSPNAWLDGGANAIGVAEDEMRTLLAKQSEFVLILKNAVAHGAMSLRRDYGQGGKNWCLLELSGLVCLAHGLTFDRGGFLARSAEHLLNTLADA